MIDPTHVKPGQEVTIEISITNISDNLEGYEAVLNINGIEEETKSIVLAGGTTGVITYNVVRDVAGKYDVENSGLTGSFTVLQSEVPE